MKCFILSCLVLVAAAEPPRFRTARFRFQRQELAPTTTDSPTEPTTDPAPYPAAGWKPDQPFSLPQEVPSDAYGAPQQAPYPPAGWKPAQPFTLPKQQEPPATDYGVPDNSYGAPTTENPDSTTTDNPEAEKLEAVDVQKIVGEYYVLLPNGVLQKVEFATENDVQNMAYTARLQLRDRAPLYLIRA